MMIALYAVLGFIAAALITTLLALLQISTQCPRCRRSYVHAETGLICPDCRIYGGDYD